MPRGGRRPADAIDAPKERRALISQISLIYTGEQRLLFLWNRWNLRNRCPPFLSPRGWLGGMPPGGLRGAHSAASAAICVRSSHQPAHTWNPTGHYRLSLRGEPRVLRLVHRLEKRKPVVSVAKLLATYSPSARLRQWPRSRFPSVGNEQHAIPEVGHNLQATGARGSGRYAQ